MSIAEDTQLMREVVDKMDYMVRVLDDNNRVIYMNEKMRKEHPQVTGDHCYKLLGGEGRCAHCISVDAIKTGNSDTKEVEIGDKFFRVISSPVNADSGDRYAIELFQDITEQKQTENELMKQYKKLKEDIEFAKGIQKSALPIDGAYWNLMHINSSYRPSEDLGGDFFDLIQVNENQALLYIADVAGHGVRSSLVTIYIRELVRGRVSGGKIELSDLLDHLIKSYNQTYINEEQYFSILLCLYDKEKNTIKIMNAGHNCLPIIIGKNGEVKEIEVKGMPVCNLIQEANHMEACERLETGDRILLYTDGVTESCNIKSKGPLGAEGVINIITENINLDGEALLEQITEGITSCSNVTPIDDVALVLGKIL